MRRKTMECLLKLKSLKECQRKVCPCAEKVRQHAVHIPNDDVDELKNDHLLKEWEKKYFICYNNIKLP